MNFADHTAVATVLNTFERVGIDAPPALIAAADRAAKLSGSARTLGKVRGGDLETAVAAAILADRDPADDAAVQRAVTLIALSANHGLPDAVIGNGHEAVRVVCVDERDTIVEAWRPAVDAAAADLLAAFARLGDVDLDADAAAILAKGGDAAEMWSRARAADEIVSAIVDAWSALMTFLHVSLSPQHRALRLAALTADEFDAAPRKLTGWGAVRAGHVIDLPTLDEYRGRIVAIERERTEQAASEQAATRSRDMGLDVAFVQRYDAARTAARSAH